MTWAEFQIRLYSFKRVEERKDIRAREIAWNALLAPHYNPKKLPKTKERFWQIGEKTTSINDAMKAKIKEAQDEYFKEKQQLENGIR